MTIDGRYNINIDSNYGSEAAMGTAVTERLLRFKGDIYTSTLSRATKATFFEMVALVREACAEDGVMPVVLCYSTRESVVSLGNKGFFVVSDGNRANGDPWDDVERNMTFDGHGTYEFITRVHARLSRVIAVSQTPLVTWEYLSGNYRASSQVQIKRAQTVYPEFYPWIGDVNAYYERYRASDSSVLILLGETGTAKTSFIRNMIWRYGMSTTFTYDAKLLEKDDMFVSFITGETNLLVVEDADILLTDRENSGNQLMSKFLNVSDGLAAPRQPKKIIFTANILEMSKIDSALMRPGRCFDCQVFRKLTFAEVCAAAKVAGISAPVEQRSYSLAELFANAKGEPDARKPNHPAFITKDL